MSEYNYTCACCGKHWHSTSTGPKPTKAEIARMVCQPCRDASKRIAALEAENAALREEVNEQDKREAKWAKRFDQQVGHFAVRLYNIRKRHVLIARRRISALRAEVAALREDKERLVEALEEIADGDGCNCRVGPGCDMKCKDIARAAIANALAKKARAK